ncbi:MAG: hypothetical protein IIA83_05315, partial [Thaumarchaeota archaeon]|nr:hypothetical protein [Nitrososphaerota archaeon]
MTIKKSPRINFRKLKIFDKPIFAGIVESIKKINTLIESLEDISEFEFSREFGTALKEALLSYAIIRLVSIIDNYFAKTVQEYVDEHNFGISDLFDNNEVTVSLSRIDQIRTKNLTKGQIIATSFNFQNPSEINTVMSKLIGDNFFELVKWSVKYHTFHKKSEKREEELLKNWDKFLRMFQIRNEIVHSSHPQITLDINYVENCIDYTIELIEKTI